ncbi:outer membrane beta-barrel protein [Rhodoflexus sp.]
MYNLKKSILLFLFLLCGTATFAQITLMPRVGGGIGTQTSNFSDEFYESEELKFYWQPNFSVGFDLLIPISGGFSIQPGIGVAQKRGKAFYKGVSRQNTHTHDIQGSGFFIEPSALLRFDLNPDQSASSLYFLAGPTLSIIAGGSVDENYLMVSNTGGRPIFDERREGMQLSGLDSREMVQPLGLAGVVGLGYRLSLGSISAFADVRYQHGLMSYLNGNYFVEEGWGYKLSLRQNTLALNVGVALPLGK